MMTYKAGILTIPALLFLDAEMNAKIEVYSDGDKEELIQLISLVLIEFGYDPDLEDKESDLNNIPAVYHCEEGCFWILKADDRLIGTIALKPHPDGCYELKRFYIHPDYRSQGYGKMMIRHLLDYAKMKKIHQIRLDTNPNAQAALSIYEKYGFKRISGYASSGLGEIFMELLM